MLGGAQLPNVGSSGWCIPYQVEWAGLVRHRAMMLTRRHRCTLMRSGQCSSVTLTPDRFVLGMAVMEHRPVVAPHTYLVFGPASQRRGMQGWAARASWGQGASHARV